MAVQELEECLQLLVGDTNFKTALPIEVTADEFAETVLGFEEVEEVEENGDEYGDEDGTMGGDMGMDAVGGAYYMQNDTIPEEDT